MLADAVNHVLRDNKLAALGRMITFEADLAPLAITGDPGRIRTIVDNLISNALKFSPRSSTIGLTLCAEGRDALLEVVDEGPGVLLEERSAIFDSFYQGAAPTEGRVKGSGLGLAIAREYAHGHGGSIDVGGRPDGKRGAAFRLRLPLAFAAVPVIPVPLVRNAAEAK
jgi:two-component system sensor histidine kinase GlrK